MKAPLKFCYLHLLLLLSFLFSFTISSPASSFSIESQRGNQSEEDTSNEIRILNESPGNERNIMQIEHHSNHINQNITNIRVDHDNNNNIIEDGRIDRSSAENSPETSKDDVLNSTETNDSVEKVTVPDLLATNETTPEVSQNSSSVTLSLRNSDSNEAEEVETFNSTVYLEKVKKKALESLVKIFGLNEQSEREPTTSPPEFMVDLYNTITDSYGITRAKNPFNAHIVRALTELNNSLYDHFTFKIPKLNPWEVVLEAELHIHRMPTSYDQLHPSLYLTPFYILSLFQVVNPNLLRIPDLHQLLGVHYVPAMGSGWEIFNVKQPLLKWMSEDAENHGFLVAASSLGGDRVPVKFARRGETANSSKQPILVLFTKDARIPEPQKATKKQSTPAVNVVKTDTNGTSSNANGNSSTTGSQSEEEESPSNIPTSSLENPRFHHTLLFKDSIRHPNSVNRFRSRRSKNKTQSAHYNSDTMGDFEKNLTSCERHDLLVNFQDIGWSKSIISPKSYNAFFCSGPCNFPIEERQQVKPSNHAIVQSIVHQLNLSRSGVGRPCCVPTALLPISLLYYEDEHVITLKQYSEMVADSCGCS